MTLFLTKDQPYISKDTKTWLVQCWNYLRTNYSPSDYKQVKLATKDITRQDFEPWKIDTGLLRNQTEITLLGLIAIKEDVGIFEIANSVFLKLRNALIEDINRSEFNLDEIATDLGQEPNLLKLAYALFCNERLFLWDGASHNLENKFLYDSIQIKDSRLTYLNNKSIRDVFNNRTNQKVEPKSSINTENDFTSNTNPEVIHFYFPQDLLFESKGYITTIGDQINACYRYGIYDASLVMIRKLLETLIIELFEKDNLQDQIKNSEENYFALSDLISQLIKNKTWELSRNTKSAIRTIKKYGDLSAHNRRFSAKKQDLDKIRDDVRVVLEELIHMCKN